MATFTIEQTATGTILFSGEARDFAHALDLMAQDAGYADYVSLPEEIGGSGTIVVTDENGNRHEPN